MSKTPAVLLASSSNAGTIAAVRSLGAHGIRVGVISSQLLSAAAWSRWCFRCYRAPREIASKAFLERLIEIGKTDPGQILLPTSDETAWLYAAHADVLKQYFGLYQPPLATVHTILDKKLFSLAAAGAGLPVLPSWEPRDEEQLAALAPTLPYPILLKPRTHVHRLRNDKGLLVQSSAELIQQYLQFVERERVRAVDDSLLSDAHLPLIQPFARVGAEGVLSITGFIDRTGQYFVARQARKVFQRSRPMGVGVCFESVQIDSMLADGVYRLCRNLGYFGIFEVEFLWFNGCWVAIDFNPRLFNQLGMDIRRSMPLPLLAYLDAANETSALESAVAEAQKAHSTARVVFRDRFTLHAILVAQTLTSRISRLNRSYWHSWMKNNAAYAVDAAADKTDPMPGIIHALSEITLGLKSFPRFLRTTPRLAASRPVKRIKTAPP